MNFCSNKITILLFVNFYLLLCLYLNLLVKSGDCKLLAFQKFAGVLRNLNFAVFLETFLLVHVLFF